MSWSFCIWGICRSPRTNYSPSTRARLHPGRRSNAWQLQLRRIFTGNANWWLFHFNFYLHCVQNISCHVLSPLRPLQPVITFNEFLTFGWAWSSAIRPSVETYLGGSLFYQLDSSTASLLSSLSFPSLLFPFLSHHVSSCLIIFLICILSSAFRIYLLLVGHQI